MDELNKKILEKLRSARGASITFALLLFLVCAVISALVVAAAMTSAGRMTNMAQADQRYYSVTSTCVLLKDLFDGGKATIVEVKATDNSTDPATETSSTYIIPNQDGGQAEITALDSTKASKYSIDTYTSNNVVREAAYRYYNDQNSEGVIQIESDDVKAENLPTISATIANDGSMKIVVSKTSSTRSVFSAAKSRPFAMELDLVADITRETSEKTIGETDYIIKTTTLKWSLDDLKTISLS